MDAALTQLKDLTFKIASIEQRISAALEVAEMGIWEWNIKDNQLIWDEQTLKVFGREQSDFNPIWTFFESIIVSEDIGLLRFKITESFKTSKFKHTYRVKLPNSCTILVSARAKIIYDIHDQPESMLGVVWRETECQKREGCPINLSLKCTVA